jgi:O-antigen/teichoic acid export membrane protein
MQNLFWLAGTVGLLGLPEAVTYFLARHRNEAGRILATGIAVSFLSALACFFLVYPLVPGILAAQGPDLVRAARWFLLGIPLYAVTCVFTRAAQGAGDLVRWNLLRLLPGAGWLVVVIVAWQAGKATAEFLAGGYLAILGCMMVPAAIMIPRLIAGPYTPSRMLMKPMVKYGLPQAGAAIPQTLNLRMDQLLIGAFLPPVQLGLYVVAVVWSSAVYPALHAIGSVLFPKIAASSASPGDRSRVLSKGVRLGVLTAGLLAVVLLALTPLMIPLLFGEAFAPAVPVGGVVVLAAAVCGINVILEECLRGLGDTAGIFWSECAGLAVTAACLVLLLPQLGILGGGVSSLLGYGTTCGALVPRICRATGLEATSFLIPRASDVRLIVVRFQAWRFAPRD